MLAAIGAANEPAPTFPLVATYASNQIAQRNLQVSAQGSTQCAYDITNSATNDAFLYLGLNVTAPPGTLINASNGVTLTFTFENPNSDFYDAWSYQAQQVLPPGTLSVTQSTDNKTTTLTVGTSAIALNAVLVPAGTSPHVSMNKTSSGGAVLNVDMSTVLTDARYESYHVILENGGSCLLQ